MRRWLATATGCVLAITAIIVVSQRTKLSHTQLVRHRLALVAGTNSKGGRQPSGGHRALHAAGDAGAIGYSAAGPDGTPGYRILHHVPGDHLDMPGGWFALEVDYQFPQPDPARYLNPRFRSLRCNAIALDHVQQPLTDLYKRRHAPPTALPGGVPRTMFRWEGHITREQFDAVPEDLKCPFCLSATRYQIIDGHLYRSGDPAAWAQERKPNLSNLQDLLLTAIHLWDLPDMDFILHNGDGCPPEGYPMLSWTICRDRHQGGFGFPSYPVWHAAMGPVQQEAYHQCIVTRYNHTSRRPVIFFRGSTTDPKYGGVLTMKNANKVARVRLHKYYSNDTVFDTKLDKIIAADEEATAYLQPLGNHLDRLEDYNQAAIILDVDGNGISGRFGSRYADYNTPVIKQASNNTAFFEHLVAPGHMFELFRNDLSDLKALGHETIEEWKTDPRRLISMSEQFQGFATVFMHQIAVAEAAAYSLLEYSKRLTWQTVRNPTFSHVPFISVCKTREVNNLPRALCAEMQARPARP